MKTAPSGRQLLPKLDVPHFLNCGEGNDSRATGVYKSSETAGNVSCILDMFGIRGKSEDEFSSKRHLKVVMRGQKTREEENSVVFTGNLKGISF